MLLEAVVEDEDRSAEDAHNKNVVHRDDKSSKHTKPLRACTGGHA